MLRSTTSEPDTSAHGCPRNELHTSGVMDSSSSGGRGPRFGADATASTGPEQSPTICAEDQGALQVDPPVRTRTTDTFASRRGFLKPLQLAFAAGQAVSSRSLWVSQALDRQGSVDVAEVGAVTRVHQRDRGLYESWHGVCTVHGQCFSDGRDIVRTATRVTLVLAALLAFAAHESRGQTHLSFSVGVGPLFTGVGFGIGGGYYAPGSLFTGADLVLGYHTPYDDEAYGLYSDSYDGWDRGYRGSRSSYSCWDYYWDSYWDPYSDWFSQCAAYRPWRNNSFRTRSWLSRSGGYYAPSSAYVYGHDAFGSHWGPSWALDPWGGYRDGYYTGRVYAGYYGGSYGSYRGGRTIYARGGRTTVVLNRPSPLIGERTGYKEDPRSRTTRTAVRRPGTATAAVGSARTPARTGAATGRRAQPSSTPAAGRAGTSARTTPPRRGGTATATQLPSRNPVARPRVTRRTPPRVSTSSDRAGARTSPQTTPATRQGRVRAPATRRPSAGTGKAIAAPPTRDRTSPTSSGRATPRSTAYRVPGTRSVQTRSWGRSTRSAPSSAPSTRSAPSLAAPSRPPTARSAPRAPKAQARPPARSSRGSSSRPVIRRRGGRGSTLDA